MSIRQISVFLDNKPGRLNKAAEILKDNGICILALYLTDTADFGILRMIVDKPDEGLKSLKGAGLAASITQVFALKVPDVPGGLFDIVSELSGWGIVVEYIYAFTMRKAGGEAVVVVKISAGDSLRKDMDPLKANMLSEDDFKFFIQ